MGDHTFIEQVVRLYRFQKMNTKGLLNDVQLCDYEVMLWRTEVRLQCIQYNTYIRYANLEVSECRRADCASADGGGFHMHVWMENSSR